MQHPVIEFYLGKRKSLEGFSLEEMWNMSDLIFSDGYFWIPWLLPITPFKNKEVVVGRKWNKRVSIFSQADADVFAQNEDIQKCYLKSVDRIFAYFELEREGSSVFPTKVLQERSFWLHPAGHETKKISRLIHSLSVCGQFELAVNLQKLAISLGTEKGYIQDKTLDIWQKII